MWKNSSHDPVKYCLMSKEILNIVGFGLAFSEVIAECFLEQFQILKFFDKILSLFILLEIHISFPFICVKQNCSILIKLNNVEL